MAAGVFNHSAVHFEGVGGWGLMGGGSEKLPTSAGPGKGSSAQSLKARNRSEIFHLFNVAKQKKLCSCDFCLQHQFLTTI